jgi:hypothetical protein
MFGNQRERREKGWALGMLKYEVILGNCNGALYVYEIYLDVFHQRNWILNPIFNYKHICILYTLGTKERILE